MLHSWTQKTLDHFQASPLRSLKGTTAPGTDHHNELARLGDHLGGLVNSLENPLSVVVMGTVKAGKSTLINALAGDVIAPTDVLVERLGDWEEGAL